MTNSNKKRENITLKVQPQELDLTSLKELLKKSQFKKKKKTKNTKGITLGIILIIIGILSLFGTLLFNRYIDREYLSDMIIIFIMVFSLFTLIMGFIITYKEIR